MIETTIIRTPQFKDGIAFDYTVQQGTIDLDTLLFLPEKHISGSVDKHRCQFHSMESYLKCKVNGDWER